MTTAKLKIGRVTDRTPIKLTISIDPSVQRDLTLYAALYSETYGDEASVLALIPVMLQTFLGSDPAFKKALKAR